MQIHHILRLINRNTNSLVLFDLLNTYLLTIKPPIKSIYAINKLLGNK